MTSEELYESYGFKAYAKGFFQQWRMETSSLIDKDRQVPRVEAARTTYERLHEQKVAEIKALQKLSIQNS